MALAHLPAEPPQGLDLQIEGLELVAQRMDEDPQRVAVRPQLRSQVGIQRALDGLRRDQPPADQEQRDLRFTLGQREQRPEPVAVNGGWAIRAHEPPLGPHWAHGKYGPIDPWTQNSRNLLFYWAFLVSAAGLEPTTP